MSLIPFLAIFLFRFQKTFQLSYFPKPCSSLVELPGFQYCLPILQYYIPKFSSTPLSFSRSLFPSRRDFFTISLFSSFSQIILSILNSRLLFLNFFCFLPFLHSYPLVPCCLIFPSSLSLITIPFLFHFQKCSLGPFSSHIVLVSQSSIIVFRYSISPTNSFLSSLFKKILSNFELFSTSYYPPLYVFSLPHISNFLPTIFHPFQYSRIF